MKRIHPNAILMAIIKSDNITRETLRDVFSEYFIFEEEDDVEICGWNYSLTIMEKDYDKEYQILAGKGDVVIHDFISFGRGNKERWEEVERRKKNLEDWCNKICEKYCGTFEIFIGANNWH
jgi:hypothetical protein